MSGIEVGTYMPTRPSGRVAGPAGASLTVKVWEEGVAERARHPEPMALVEV